MSSEWNLSDKEFICDKSFIYANERKRVILSKDVKEAVRLLKEGIHDFNEMESGDRGRNELIDKIFGEKLI